MSNVEKAGLAATAERGPAVPSTGTHLFTRNATGLVRDLSGPQQVVWNWIAGAPMLGLAFGVFVGLSGFPGGNLFLGILLTVPLALATAYAFGLLTAAMPRSGGDYTLVSRTLHPAVALAGNFCWVLTQGLSCALIGGLLFTALGVAPSLTTIGLVSGNHTLINWGTTVATSHGWQFAIGAVCILLGGGFVAMGWRSTKRLLFGLLAFSTGGLLLSVLIALFTSKSGFSSHFNDFAHQLTGKGGAYADTIATAKKAGVNPSPAFSFSKTLPLVAIFGSFGIFGFMSSYVGGELREGATIKTAHRMAAGALLGLGSMALFIAIFFHSWGRDFVTSAYAGGFPKAFGGVTPTYFVLTSLQLHSTFFTVLECVAFLAFPPVLVGYLLVVISRSMFAWAFDGVFPAGIAKVSRNNAPVLAVALATLFALVLHAWAIFVAKNIVKVIAYTGLIQLIPIALVGIAAMIVPRFRPSIYRAVGTTRKFAGVPILVIAGFGAIFTVVVNWYLYFHYAYFALGSRGTFFLWVGVTAALGVIVYYVARVVRRSQGVDLDLVYREIPPE
jgi:amino acid transporter